MNIVENFNSGSNVIQIYSMTTHTMYEFLAFVTDFSDTRSCMWNSQEIYGRMDSVYTYKNTSRKISISFDVPIFSEDQKLYLHNVLKNEIKKTFYPIYSKRQLKPQGDIKTARVVSQVSSDYSLASPPYHRIRFANLIKSKIDFDIIPQSYFNVHGMMENNLEQRTANPAGITTKAIKSGLLGWIDGYSFNPVLESGYFEIPIPGSQVNTRSKTLVSKLYKIKLTLNVIHEHPLGFKTDTGAGQKIRVSTKEMNYAPAEYEPVDEPRVSEEPPVTPASEGEARATEAVTNGSPT